MDGIGLAEKMLGLRGVVVLDVEDVPGEVVITVESIRVKANGPSCRRRAEAQDRVVVHLRDLHLCGRPLRLVVRKRRWRCKTAGCVRKTWTERLAGIAPRQVLTVRAGAEVTRQVGQLCRSVASVADEYGVGCVGSASKGVLRLKSLNNLRLVGPRYSIADSITARPRSDPKSRFTHLRRGKLVDGELLWCEHVLGEREDVPVVSEEQNLVRRRKHGEAAEGGAGAVVVKIDKDVVEHDRHRTVATKCLFDRSQP